MRVGGVRLTLLLVLIVMCLIFFYGLWTLVTWGIYHG